MAAVLTAALLLPLTAHSTAELADWYSSWLATPETSDIKVELLRDMEARHPCFPEACQLEEVMPTADYVGAVATPPPANSGMGTNVEQWRSLVAAYFPADQIDRALRIMACESGGNPNAYNPSGASGLMQVLASWADNFGYTPSQLFDPDINLYVASLLYQDGGWGHWVCRG